MEGIIPWDNITVYAGNHNLKLCERAKRAPQGKATLYLFCCVVPGRLQDGTSWDHHKMRFAQALIDRLEE